MLSNNLQVLCTGNPNNPGLPAEIVAAFPNTICLHKSAGVDLLTEEGLDYFRQLVRKCNVFVNVSNIPNRTQEKLLRIASEEMTGHVFNIGSIAEHSKWESYDPVYTFEKRQLREASLSLCRQQFKTTHMIVGGFQDYDDASPDRMDPAEIVKLIKYILQSPVNIPIVGIEKI